VACAPLFSGDTKLPLDFDFNVPGEVGDAAELPGPAHVKTSPIFTEIPGQIGSHASSIVSLENGDLLAAWYSYEGPHELEGSAIFIARRLAGSQGWTSPTRLIDWPLGDGNPVLYAEGSRVWLFHAVVPGGWSLSHVELTISEDLGRTWGESRHIGPLFGLNVRAKPIRLADGRYLLPTYDEIIQHAVFFLSDDGIDWDFQGQSALLPPHYQPAVVELAAGDILALTRNPEKTGLRILFSVDHGAVWSGPELSGFADPGAGFDLLKLRDGDFVLAFKDGEKERFPLTLALSDDEGRTWPYRRELDDPDGGFTYPSLTESDDSLIHVTFSQSRRHIQHAEVSKAWIAGQ
jgi:predicted neuraminidase